MSNISKIKYINIQRINKHGFINVAEVNKHITFKIKRIYFINNLGNSKKTRGFHAHKKLEQFFICIKGSFEFKFYDGVKIRKLILQSNNKKALYVPNLIWREFFQLKKNSILLVICNDYYKKEDYIYDINNM